MKTYTVMMTMVFLSLTVSGQSSGGYDIPFVPTPMDVVNIMLDMAQVKEGDLLFDLGCGDGRIAIAASSRGAHGIGIDTDAQRVTECMTNARMAGAANKVTFFQSDLFQVPLTQASVIAIYLTPDANLRLRPKLLSELHPGSRVVSHDFNMGNWEADSIVRTSNSTVYLWVVPANFSGTWNWFHVNEAGRNFKLNVSQHFQKLSGKISSNAGIPTIKYLQIRGDQIRVILQEEKGKEIRLSGVIEGNRIDGTITLPGGSRLKWQALREESTMQPLFFPQNGI